jgi:hypothetical protein
LFKLANLALFSLFDVKIG